MNPNVFADYLKNRPLFMSLVRSQEIAFYQRYLTNSEKVLDFGCGDGFFLQTLKKFHSPGFKNSQIFGLDLIDNSRVTTLPKKLYSQVDLYDGNKMPYQANSFNSIIANCVFEHLPNLEIILKQLYKVLKPKGKLYATVMANNWEDYLRLPAFFWRKVQVHHNLLSFLAWQKQFQNTGFKVLKTKGYLNREQSQLIELTHFTSFPYLVSYKLFKRWDLPGNFYQLLVDKNKIAALFAKEIPLKQSAGLFVVLQKP